MNRDKDYKDMESGSTNGPLGYIFYDRLSLKTRNILLIIRIALAIILLILLLLFQLKMSSGDIFGSRSNAMAGEASNEYACGHYFSLLANVMERSETPFRMGEHDSFNPGPPSTLHKNFVSSGIYWPMEMEMADGKVVVYSIVAYWLTPQGEVKEDLVALGVELPDGDERFFLNDPAVDSLQAARASLKPGVVFTATMTGFVNQHGVDWAGCPGSDFAGRYGEQARLVGAALAKDNPPEVSSGFTGSFLFGWQLEKTGEMIPFPICQYIEES